MQNELRLFLYYWELFWRRPVVWLLPSVLIVMAGTFYILSQPRTYTSEATIVVRSGWISPDLVQSTVMNERLQFIEQRVFVRDNLVELASKFDLFPGLRDTISKSALAALVRGRINITSDTPQPVAPSADHTIFRISFEGEAPELVASVAAEIVSMIMNENRRARLSQASDATHFLEREVNVMTDRLRVLDAGWDEFIRVNQSALPSRQSALLQEIQSQQQELNQLDTRNADLTSQIRILKAELALEMPMANATVRSQTEQLSALKTQLATRLSVLSEAHPEIKTLRSRIALLEAEMAQPRPQIVADGSPEVESLGPELGLIAERIRSAEQQQSDLLKRREQLSTSLDSLNEIVSRMPEVEAEMISLERERSATQRNLDDMAARLNTARLSERLEFDQQADQIELLESAEVPEHASGPRRKQMMLMVLILAAGSGLAAVLAMDMMDKTIRGSFDISRGLEGRTLVIVPAFSNKPRRGLQKIFRNLSAGLIC